MVEINPTTDLQLIKLIITAPSIYPHVSDDTSPPPEQYEAPDGPAYLVVSQGETLLGMFCLVARTTAIVEVHTCLLPAAYGTLADEAAQKLIDWVWSHTKFNRLVTDVPIVNRLAVVFAERAGMRQYGYNPKSFLKHGEYQDQVMFGLTRPADDTGKQVN